MEYPWPERRYYSTGGKPPAPRKAKDNLSSSSPEPTITEYRQLLLSLVNCDDRYKMVSIKNEAHRLLSRGVPRNGEQG